MSVIQKYVNSKLFMRLTTWVKNTRKIYQENGKNADLLHAIAEDFNFISKSETNINAHININQGASISVRIPDLTKNGALYGPWFKSYLSNSGAYQLFDDDKDTTVGYCDQFTGKVHGCFETPIVAVFIGTSFIRGDTYEPEMIAAALCHELGHYFWFCNFLSCLYTTNHRLRELNDRLTNGTDSSKRVTIIAKSIKAMNPKSKADAEKIAAIDDDTVVGVSVLSEALENSKSEFGTNVYDWTSWEEMADRYATLQGAGVWNVKALDKLYLADYNINRRPYSAYLLMETAKIFSTILFPPLGIYMIVCDTQDERYDKPKDRMNRIRNTLLGAIDTDKEFTSEEITNIKESIKEIEDIMENYGDREQFYYPIVWLLSSSERKESRNTATQKDIEDLAAHVLRLRVAEFKTTAKIKGL